jgi:hypothetical protein
VGDCVDGVAPVSVNYTATSEGSAAAAAISYDINAGAKVAWGTILDGNILDGGGWTFNGRTKTATGSIPLHLGSGSYTIEVCVEQPGNPAKKTACNTVTVVVNCSTGPCQGTQLFGEIVGNDNLCKSDAHINVQVKGMFGDSAELTVKDQSNAVVDDHQWTHRSGDSCVYHWNLDPKSWNNGSPGAGTYHFHIDGANQEVYDFAAELSCSKPGKK